MRKLILLAAAGLFALTSSAVDAATYSALASMDSQVAKAPMTGYPIVMTGDVTDGYKVEGSKITILRAGDYFVSGAAQVGGTGTGDVYLWVRVNGQDVTDSNSIQTIPSQGFTAVLVATTEMTFKAGDVLELVYAATQPGLGLVASRPKGLPGVPSIIFSIFEL